MALKPTAEPKGGQMGLLLDGSMSLDDRDRYIIQTVLKRNQYNVTMAARVLGTTREMLRYRIDKCGLRAEVNKGRE